MHWEEYHWSCDECDDDEYTDVDGPPPGWTHDPDRDPVDLCPKHSEEAEVSDPDG